jgi:branched-chain amino acid transport system substrate-binding protein
MRRPSARTTRVAAVTVLAAASVAACSLTNTGTPAPSSSAGPSGTPITVGFSEPLTGSFSVDGQASLKGYQLWRDDVNTHGGLLGRPVKLVYLNDNSNPNTAKKDYTTLITQDHVDLTLGPFSSLLTTAVEPVMHKYGYAFVEGSGGAPAVYASRLDDLFAVSAPVATQMKPFALWVKSLPPGTRPKTAAYAMVDDPFADPPVENAQSILQGAGIQTVYSNNPLPGATPAGAATAKLYEPDPKTGVVPPAVLTAAASKLVSLHPQIVVIGSVDVPTLAAFIKVFIQRGFNPQMIIAASGPDQGQAFLNAVGTGNADGIMVPDGWYGSYPNALSHVLVQEYIAKYGGTASDINADVAEAYSSGEVLADAVANVGLSNSTIIGYLHGLRQPLDTVQGPVMFDNVGANIKAASFVFQWEPVGRFAQVLSSQGLPSRGIQPVKPQWAGG